MTHRNQILTLGMAGLLTAALPAILVAQESNARPQGAEAAGTADEQQHTQRVIARALNRAIDGGDLQIAAQSARGGRFQDGQRRDAQNRRDNDADAQNRQGDDNAANAQNRRDNDAENQQRQQAHQQVVQQLQRQARQEFEASTRLLGATAEDLRGPEDRAANRPEDRSAWSRRLHTAANQYVQTLQDLSGIQASRSGASDSVGGAADREGDRATAGGRSDQDQNAGAGRLNRTDAARVVLVNHAVRQALEAFEINQWTQAVGSPRAAARGASAQRIQEHAQRLAAESRQILRSVQDGVQGRDGDADDRRDNPAAGQRNDAAGNREAAGQQGQATVQVLAQQAQRVVDTLQRISGAGEAQRGPGAENR